METGCLKCGANLASAYLVGFCHPCATTILGAEQKKLARPKGDTAAKKLQQDIERAQYAIHCCEVALTKPQFAGPIWEQAIKSETLRLHRAIAEPWRLWPIYRRADKGQPYAVKPVEVEPVAIAA